jgi:hypothetical protein
MMWDSITYYRDRPPFKAVILVVVAVVTARTVAVAVLEIYPFFYFQNWYCGSHTRF